MMDATEVLRRSAARFGSSTALRDAHGSVSFARLADRVRRLACGLRGLGLRPGDRVLDLQPNQVTYVETDLACMAAGLVRVALNYRLHDADWQRIAADCDARAIIYDGAFADRAQGLREALDISLMVGEEYERLISRSPDAVVGVGDLVSLNYTSGTTGNPKGVRRHHTQRLTSLANMALDVLGGLPSRDDVYLHAGPVTHTSGLFVLPFLAAGATQLIHSRFDAAAVLEAVREQGVTHTALVPTMIARMIDAQDGEPLASMKMLAYAGAPMPPEQIRRAAASLSPRLVQYYGLVEAIPPLTVLDTADHQRGIASDPDLLTSAGRPGTLVDIRVVDAEGSEVAPGEVGEVVTRGPHVMPGYWHDGDTVKSIKDGWLHTGDLGRRDATGRLWLIDRKGDMILTGGYNVYPREIEEVLATAPGVNQVAVYGVDDPQWGQRITAAYTGPASRQDLEEHCRQRLASFKKPKVFRKLEAFPLNSTGKIDKKALRTDG